MFDFRDQSVSIVGLGRSGLALAKVLGERGCSLLLSDGRDETSLGPALEGLSGLSYELETGGQTSRIHEGRDMVLISPGVSVHHPELRRAIASGVPVLGEVEVAWTLSPKPFVAVTGTNGKSTTATLIGLMLGESGKVAGNIGLALVGEVTSLPAEVDWVVAEVSSFQLETVHQFCPEIAVLTNVTPDHLDRHPTLEEYYAAKARLFARQGPEQLAVFAVDDPEARRMAQQLREGSLPGWLGGFPAPRVGPPPEIWHVSALGPVEKGVGLVEGQVVFFDGDSSQTLFSFDFDNLPGPHNLVNALTAIAVGVRQGLSPERMQRGLRQFSNLHYRLETVARVNGVRWVNDSKATNVASVVAALESYPAPLTLIAGGKDKGFDFAPLAQAVSQRVAYLILIGEASGRIAAELEPLGYETLEVALTLPAAVARAEEVTPSGGTVLLSPACSSFDMFKNAEDRGAQFEALVLALKDNER